MYFKASNPKSPLFLSQFSVRYYTINKKDKYETIVYTPERKLVSHREEPSESILEAKHVTLFLNTSTEVL